MKKLLSYSVLFVILILLSSVKVYAAPTSYYNYDTNFTIEIPEDIIDFDEVVDSTNNITLGDFIDNVMSLQKGTNKRLQIELRYNARLELANINLILYNENTEYREISIPARYNSIGNKTYMTYGIEDNQYSRKLYQVNPQTNIYQATNYQSFYSCYVNNTCLSETTGRAEIAIFTGYSGNRFNNSNSYTITQQSNQESTLLFYSEIPAIIKNTRCSASSDNHITCYFKNIIINEQNYGVNSILPSYWDLYLRPNQSFDRYSPSIDFIFGGEIPKANIGSYHIDMTFWANDERYVENHRLNIEYFGRINHNDKYYSYEKINCSAQTYLEAAKNNNKYMYAILPHGFTCTSDLTNYDNIYIRIANDDIGNGNPTIYNISYSSNYGNVYLLEQQNVLKNNVFIYEHFNNLPSNFSMILSTQKATQKWLSYSDNNQKYIYDTCINRTNNEISRTGCSQTFGTTTNTNGMIFNLQQYYTGTTNLDLFMDYNTILSISNNDVYTYYDDNNSLTESLITNDVIITEDTSYDLSYYFGIVDSYLDDINGDLYNLHTITQNTYDIIPSNYQIALFILFIMACIFLLMNLIKR